MRDLHYFYLLSIYSKEPSKVEKLVKEYARFSQQLGDK